MRQRDSRLDTMLPGGQATLADRLGFVRPTPMMADVVERYWWLEASSARTMIHLWPGTGAEIIWPFGQIRLDWPAGSRYLTDPTMVAFRSGRGRLLVEAGTALFVVRLRYGGLARLGVGDLHAMIDRPVPLRRGGGPSRSVAGHSAPPSELSELSGLVQPWLAERRESHAPSRIAGAIDAYYRDPGGVKVSDASALSHLSERQVRRDFLSMVGVGPKQFQRLVRFQRTLKTILLDPGNPPTPHALGYADQPHQSRDFVALAGMPPRDMRASGLAHTFFESLD